MKKQQKGFTYRSFSEAAGMKAPNFLQLIIQGKRNLGPASVSQVSAVIGHSSNEEKYFKAMVQFDQAADSEEKNRQFQILTELRKPWQADKLSEAQHEHYKKWYHSAIRELLGFYHFHPEEKWAFRRLAGLLAPAISESQARTAVKNLLKLGMIEKSETGRLVQVNRFITTGDEVNSLFIRQFHKSMTDLAVSSQDRIGRDLRDISSLTVSISDSGFQTLKKELQLFRKRLLEKVKEDSDPENVYQVNFQLFPLTQVKKMRKLRGALK